MGQVEEFIIKLKDQFSKPLGTANAAIAHTRHQYMDLKEMLEGAVIAYGIERFVDSTLEAFNEARQAAGQVRAALHSTGNAAGESFGELNEQAEKFEENSLFKSDDIFKKVTANMLTFTSVTKSHFQEAQQVALDLSARLGEDLQGATIQVGKALNDPITGITALHRVGVAFSQSQKDQIKHFQETNQLGKAQAIILKELNTEFGGSAKMQSEVGTGPWQQFTNSLQHTKEVFGELFAGIGDNILPALKEVNKLVKEGGEWLLEHRKGVMVVVGALTGFLTAVGLLITATKAWVAIQAILDAELWANPIGLVLVAVLTLSAAVYEAWQNFGEFRGALKGVWEAMKVVGENIKNHFLEIPGMIIDAFKSIPENFIKMFSGIGKIIGALLTGHFKEIPALMKDVGEGILKSNPLTAVPAKLISEFTKGAGDAASAVYEKEIEDQKRADEEKAKKKAQQDAEDAKGHGKDGKGGEDGKLGAGLAEIKTGAPKTFNINIQKLNGIEHFETINWKEVPRKAAEGMLEQLVAALNDMQAM